MENSQLPPELARLERDLVARPLADPSPELRSRVMGDVRAGLRPEPSRRWSPFAAEVAAAALLGINLSWAAVQSTETGVGFGNEHGSVAADSRRIRELVPELSPHEATRTALLLHSASDLDRCRPFPLGLVACGRPGNTERTSH